MSDDKFKALVANLVRTAIDTPNEHKPAAGPLFGKAIGLSELFELQMARLCSEGLSKALEIMLLRKREDVIRAAMGLTQNYVLPFLPVLPFPLVGTPPLVAWIRWRNGRATVLEGEVVHAATRGFYPHRNLDTVKCPTEPYFAIGIRPEPGEDSLERPRWVAEAEALKLDPPPFTPLTAAEIVAYCQHMPVELETRWVAAAGSRTDFGPERGWPTVGVVAGHAYLMNALDSDDPAQKPALPFTVPTCKMRI